MLSVNLIPIRRRQERRLRARARKWGVAVSVYAVLLALGYVAWRLEWATDDRDFTRQLTLVHSDLDEAAKSIDALRASLKESQLVLQLNQAVAGQPDWSLLLALLGKLRGEDIVLNRCDLEAAPKGSTALLDEFAVPVVLKIQGYGNTQAEVSQFALRLERTGLFQDVSLVKTNRESFLAGEAVAFRLECQLKSDSTDVAPGKPKPVSRGGNLADVSEAGGSAP